MGTGSGQGPPTVAQQMLIVGFMAFAHPGATHPVLPLGPAWHPSTHCHPKPGSLWRCQALQVPGGTPAGLTKGRGQPWGSSLGARGALHRPQDSLGQCRCLFVSWAPDTQVMWQHPLRSVGKREIWDSYWLLESTHD